MFERHIKVISIISLLLILLTGAFLSQAQDDGRINLVGHFGGDALYCDEVDGCTLLNTNGEALWNVPQAVISETFTEACDAGISFEIEAGMGTHGPSVMVISCYEGYEPSLKLKAYDEHGKINEIRFPQDYSPAKPAVAPQATEETATPTPEPTLCAAVADPCAPEPTPEPTLCPSEIGPCAPEPTPEPTVCPVDPSGCEPEPTPEPTVCPAVSESCTPTPEPTLCPGTPSGCEPEPTPEPTVCPVDPSGCEPEPTPEPTLCPAGADPCETPTPEPTPEPTLCPAGEIPCEPEPTPEPTEEPTIEPCSVGPASELKTQSC